jgi:hypothetical protein
MEFRLQLRNTPEIICLVAVSFGIVSWWGKLSCKVITQCKRKRNFWYSYEEGFIFRYALQCPYGKVKSFLSLYRSLHAGDM